MEFFKYLKEQIDRWLQYFLNVHNLRWKYEFRVNFLPCDLFFVTVRSIGGNGYYVLEQKHLLIFRIYNLTINIILIC